MCIVTFRSQRLFNALSSKLIDHYIIIINSKGWNPIKDVESSATRLILGLLSSYIRHTPALPSGTTFK